MDVLPCNLQNKDRPMSTTAQQGFEEFISRVRRAAKDGSLHPMKVRTDNGSEFVGGADVTPLRIVTIRHGLKIVVLILPCFGILACHFRARMDHPINAPFGIRLKSTRPSHGRVLWSLHPPEARQKPHCRGFTHRNARNTPPPLEWKFAHGARRSPI